MADQDGYMVSFLHCTLNTEISYLVLLPRCCLIPHLSPWILQQTKRRLFIGRAVFCIVSHCGSDMSLLIIM